jgi:hypothetical protein
MRVYAELYLSMMGALSVMGVYTLHRCKVIAQLKSCGLGLQGCAPLPWGGAYFGDVCWEKGLIRHGPYYGQI